MKSPRYLSQQLGFTLIELMVVVAIIGILMAAGILAFSNAQRNARDAARIADMDAISKALEQYYADNNAYPVLNADSNNASVITVLGQYFPTGSPPDEVYSTRAYRVRSQANEYCVHIAIGSGNTAGLEGSTSRLNCTGGSTSCTYVTSGATTFCVENRQ